MRVFLGMILGAAITVLAAYAHDSTRTPGETAMVNWDVVDQNWQAAKTRVQHGWTQISSKLNS